MRPMNYSISQKDAVQIVSVQDLLSEFDNKKILSDIELHLEEGLHKLVVDLSRLDFMNSVGLNFLIALMTKSRKSGMTLTVANPSQQVLKLLEMTKLKSFFHLTPSVEDALKSLSDN